MRDVALSDCPPCQPDTHPAKTVVVDRSASTKRVHALLRSQSPGNLGIVSSFTRCIACIRVQEARQECLARKEWFKF